MARKNKQADFAQQEEEILARLDILAEYRSMGVIFASEQPRSSGIIECYARGRDESKPSAFVNTETGRYGDSASNENLSLWEFAAKYAGQPDWRAARGFFASKAGVQLGGGKQKSSPLDSLEFLPWHEGHDRLAAIWCKKHKQGASLEAVKLSGGRIARYPCWTDKKTGERHRGEFTVISLPCFGSKLLTAPPVAWVIYNINGADLPVRRGKDLPTDWVKMKSVGETRGAMMGLHALQILADPAGRGSVELIYKTGGPSDLLAIQAAVLRDRPDLRDRHLVVTNASGEAADVLPHQAALFQSLRAVIIGDQDEAGAIGVLKWQAALMGVAAEIRAPQLPYLMQKKHGKDARDFLNGVESDLAPQAGAAA